ncbi:hypothetical protein FOZ63_013086, partial [Perkinsus olseni]
KREDTEGDAAVVTEDGTLKRLSKHDSYILDTLFDEIMTAFDKHVGECAKQLLKIPVLSEDFLPRLVDSMFNRLVRPCPMDRIQEVMRGGEAV